MSKITELPAVAQKQTQLKRQHPISAFSMIPNHLPGALTKQATSPSCDGHPKSPIRGGHWWEDYSSRVRRIGN